MSPVRRLVDDGIQVALNYAVPVAKRLRFALTDAQVDREMAALRRELDESRAALKLQTARCRQLVAAYSARLKAGNDLRDHQLALVLRALVALEARLRREQKAIRSQLAQRDAIIHQQQVEISRLRGAHAAPSAAFSPPHPAARTGAAPSTPATPSQLIVENHTCGQDSACVQAHETVVDAMSHLRHQEAALRVLELVGPPPGPTGFPGLGSLGTATRGPPATTVLPLLNGETACIVEPPADFIEDNMAVTPPPDVVASYNDMNRECLELASMAASLRSADKDKAVCFQDNPVLECVNLILLRDQEDFQEERRGRHRERGPESARLRRGRRSVEESPPPPPSSEPPSSEPPAWYNSTGSAAKDVAREAPRRPTPPALPPKPPRLVAQRPTRATKSPTPTKDAKDDDPRTVPSIPTTPPPASPAPSSPTTATVVSATTPSSDLEESSDALRRNFEEFNLDDCDIEGLGETDTPAVETEADTKAEANGDGRPRLEGDGAESLKLNGHGPVPVPGPGHVLQDAPDALPLLTAPAEAPSPLSASANGLAVNLGPVLAGTLAQQLAQLAPLAPNSLANYDTFLEATGLSNKSILTPSRMLSNHRSVLKPKDVKHRSRVKAGERCAGPSCATGPTVKYWTEPFL
ncbi:uncharacterized protein LOC117641764 [Thrips palmi]|uniref:Uncharacterized protein LOC117641764 n=1 Tax=Thrips palmi TaxID=161013 RepID=A0A6P8ZJF3_THRPL|nr:uncharacterized protein LOC117641764 [Thrips palmi]